MPDQETPATEIAATIEKAPEAGVPAAAKKPVTKPVRPPEFGGPAGPEPTRYGDWERNGRVSDF